MCEHCPQESLSSTQSQRAQRTVCTVRAILKAFGVVFEAVVLSDASAGIGIASRQGCGRLKHLEVKWLWVQEKVSEKALRLRKHPTETNIADLANKVLVKTSHGNAIDSEQSCLDQERGRNDEYTVTGCWFRTS